MNKPSREYVSQVFASLHSAEKDLFVLAKLTGLSPVALLIAGPDFLTRSLQSLAQVQELSNVASVEFGKKLD